MAGGGRRQSREQAKTGRGVDVERGGGCSARVDPSRRSAVAAQAGESGGGVPSGCCVGRGGRHVSMDFVSQEHGVPRDRPKDSNAGG
jgi:hypothetical protein